MNDGLNVVVFIITNVIITFYFLPYCAPRIRMNNNHVLFSILRDTPPIDKHYITIMQLPFDTNGILNEWFKFFLCDEYTLHSIIQQWTFTSEI